MKEFLAGVIALVVIAVVAGVVLNAVGGWSAWEAYRTSSAESPKPTGHLMVK